MFSTKSNRNRKGQYASKDSHLSKAERADRRRAADELQNRMLAEQKARLAKEQAELRAILQVKAVTI